MGRDSEVAIAESVLEQEEFGSRARRNSVSSCQSSVASPLMEGSRNSENGVKKLEIVVVVKKDDDKTTEQNSR